MLFPRRRRYRGSSPDTRTPRAYFGHEGLNTPRPPHAPHTTSPSAVANLKPDRPTPPHPPISRTPANALTI